jgi:uncharacterized protein
VVARLRRTIGELTGRNDRRFIELLARQIDASLRGAELVRAVVAEGEEVDLGLRAQVREIEHEGDEERAEMVDALSRALVTPIDREDLYRLSRGIDDVLDNLRDFSREWDLFGAHRQETFAPLFDEMIDGLREMRHAAERIVDDPENVSLGSLEVKRAGTRLRRSYQEAIADLLAADDEIVTNEVLKVRLLLRRLDIVGLRLTQAADILSDAAVKRSH